MSESIVKPIEWEDCGEDEGDIADTMVGRYWALPVKGSYRLLFVYMDRENAYQTILVEGVNREQAKDAAQSNYEARILSALSPSIASLQAENERLKAALVPFRKVAGRLFDQNANAGDMALELPHVPHQTDIWLTAGDFFAVAAALGGNGDE